MKGIREHLKKNMTETDEPSCGVTNGCPSGCSCVHINNVGNKIKK